MFVEGACQCSKRVTCKIMINVCVSSSAAAAQMEMLVDTLCVEYLDFGVLAWVRAHTHRAFE